MKGLHPNLKRSAASLMAAALFAMGCRSTSSGVNNPFLAPDRVAPPSTRVLAPGQAQPYYQGDPLPVMQSAAGTTANGQLASDASAGRTSTGSALAWNAPASGTSSSAPPTSTVPPWGVMPQTTAPIARANEAAVSVPADSDTLRFALPSPSIGQSTTGLAGNPITAPQSSQATAPATVQSVALASYNVPSNNGSTPVGTPVTLDAPPQAASPWRSPQFGSSTSAMPGFAQAPSVVSPAMSQPYVSPAAPSYATIQAPPAMPTNPMAVSLRSVASPPPQPGDPMPRVRVPGYDVPESPVNDNFRARTSMR